MHVLELSTARVWGGGETHLRLLCQGLVRRGHDVTIVCPNGSPVGRTLAGEGLPVVPLPKNPFELARIIGARGIELLHAHQSKGAQLAVELHYLTGRPRVVLTRHALGPPNKDLRPGSLAGLIAVSAAVAEDCRRAGFAADKTAVVPNGVDTGAFHPGFPPIRREEIALPTNAGIVAIPGRLSPEKGCRDALLALLPLMDRLQFCLLILGEGEERKALEKTAERSGCADRVRFLGQQPDVRPYLALADVVVTPGPREAFGLAMLEAMAMGKAVVAIHAGGVPEVVTDGENGLLISPGDKIGLAAAVYRLLRDEALRDLLGRKATQRAREFSATRMLDRTEEALRKFLNPSRSPRG